MITRLAFSKQWRRTREKARAEAAAQSLLAGLDSELFLIEKRLAELGLEWRASETLAAWLARVRTESVSEVAALGQTLALHHRLRFDPKCASLRLRRRPNGPDRKAEARIAFR